MRDTVQEDFEGKPWIPKDNLGMAALDVHKVASDKRLLPSIIAFANYLKDNQYASTGLFLLHISYADLRQFDHLYRTVEGYLEVSKEAKEQAYRSLITLVMLLELAEGQSDMTTDPKELELLIARMKVMFQIEAISRRSNQRITYTNYTLNKESVMHKPVLKEGIISSGRTFSQWRNLINSGGNSNGNNSTDSPNKS